MNAPGNSIRHRLIPVRSVAALLLTLLWAGCAKSGVSELFRSQIVDYLHQGGRLSTQSSDGINVLQLADQLTTAKASFDLLKQTWPIGFAPGAEEEFAKSHLGYALALRLWKAKIDQLDYPTEPDADGKDVNGWSAYEEYAGPSLVVDKWEANSLVTEYSGRRRLRFDPNISVLLTVAAKHFDAGRAKVLEAMR